ncbi:EamA family transporter, partial [Elusimicrobiota bacterium]
MINKYKGEIYILISAVLFAMMSLLIRYATKNMVINVFIVILVRNIVSLAVLYTVTFIKGGPLFGTNKKLLLMRGVTGTCGMVLSFFALSKTYVANAMVLLFTYPIVATIISAVYNRQRIGRSGLLLLMSFTGIIFI